MNERQAYALAHPLNRANLGKAALEPLSTTTELPGGNLLRIVLAVDR